MGASNVHYHEWEGMFAMADELVAFGTPGATPKLLPVIGVPKLNINPNFIDTGETGRGRGERGPDEFALGNIESSASFQTRMGSIWMYKALAALTQTKPVGVEAPAASGFFKHEFFVYSGQPSANIGFTLWKAWHHTTANHARRVAGNLVSSLKVSSAQNEIAKMDWATMGLSGGRATLTSPGSSWSPGTLLMHRNLITAKINGASIDPFPAALEYTAVNNPVPYNGGSQTPTELVLGQFNITGTLTISARGPGSAELDNFLNKNNVKLTFGYGLVVNQTGYVEAEFDATYSGADDASLNGIVGEALPFVSGIAATSPTVTKFTVWHSADLSV